MDLDSGAAPPAVAPPAASPRPPQPSRPSRRAGGRLDAHNPTASGSHRGGGPGSGPGQARPLDQNTGSSFARGRNCQQSGYASNSNSEQLVASTSSSSPSSSSLPEAQQQQQRRYPQVDPANIVGRPAPVSAKNAREFQISQFQKRFRCGGHERDTSFTIALTPTDPDFPYPIDVLKFLFMVPIGYTSAEDARPSIKVVNEDIPMGFKVNIERGFDDLVTIGKSATLLDLLNSLDKNLEKFLANEKASTYKIVPHFKETPVPPPPPPPPAPSSSPPVAVSKPVIVYQPVYSEEQIVAARTKRELDTRQLEARLKFSPIFHKSADGIAYTVPLEPQKKDQLPIPLQSIRFVRLLVPMSFNLELPRIEFPGVPADVASRVQKQFAKQAKNNPNFSLMAHLNALASNLHVMATEGDDGEEKNGEKNIEAPDVSKLTVDDIKSPEENISQTSTQTDKAHVQIIPRPSNWVFPDQDDSDGNSDDESEYDESSDVEPVSEGEDRKNKLHASNDQVLERGTALSFPGLQMHGIQLLEVTSLNVTIKCMRCKTESDITNLKPAMSGRPSHPRLGHCEKCSQVIGIGFRKEFIHENSVRLGFFDLANCSVVAILPSDFVPECSNCSSALPPPGIKGLVRGQSITTNCRECHQKLSVYISETKLLRISYDDHVALGPNVPAKKPREDRLVAGTELPLRGRCAHYRKSTRWFRFSCCAKIYPCDKCHDEQVQPQHYAEHANRMICGACSREQNYRPEDCAFCHHAFFKKNTGYWEGGKGTRDRRLLRRNDPRKHKRVNKPLA